MVNKDIYSAKDSNQNRYLEDKENSKYNVIIIGTIAILLALVTYYCLFIKPPLATQVLTTTPAIELYKK
jgi:hypothetical protein